MSLLRVGLVQQACGDDRAANQQRTEALLRQGAGQGAQLLLLQELHNSIYFCQCENEDYCEWAEPLPGPTTDWLAGLSRELGVVIVGSVFERRAAGLYHNTAVVLEDGRLAGRYRKTHIPDDPHFYEKFYFTPGDLPLRPVNTRLGRLGVLVCWDQWYPEAARLMALGGADLLLYPSAIGWFPTDDAAEQARQQEAWITVQRGHAVANGLPVLTVNRCGFEPDPAGVGPGISFWGSSFVADTQGQLIARADADSETVLLADLDLRATERTRRTWPFLRDRRVDCYADLTRRWRD